MCLYSKDIINPRYKPNKKNGGNVPAVSDYRKYMIPVACGKCIECKKRKARDWNIRLIEDLKEHKNGHFVTLTYDRKHLKKYKDRARKKAKDLGINFKKNAYWLDNEIARDSVRHFLERYRKKNKKSIRHWLITELGTKKTNRLHIHGFLWFGSEVDHKTRLDYKFRSDMNKEIYKYWQNGKVDVGYSYNRQCIKYTTKYLHKSNPTYPNYTPKLMISAGIGKHYIKNLYGKKYDYYVSDSGHKMSLPLYYRNAIFNEDERNDMWSEKLDLDVRYVMKSKIENFSQNKDRYYDLLDYWRKENERLGYKVGSPEEIMKENIKRFTYQQFI